jgi:tight adherence protein B
MISLLVIIIGVALVLASLFSKKTHHNYLREFNQIGLQNAVLSDKQAIDLKSLSEKNWLDALKMRWVNFMKQLGSFPKIKLVVVCVCLVLLSVEFNSRFIRGSQTVVTALFVVFGLIFFYRWVQNRERKHFDETFPDALNMLTSAVSAGESITHAIAYVGKNLNGEVGLEFKKMGQRLQLGEPVDDVFQKSCRRFPYPSFYFFIICLRANIQRGGQLKEIMSRLNRMMFNARGMDKKMLAMTAEARMSVKIVAAIPFIFLLMLQFISPENYEFVMFHPSGRPILYYVLVSEFIGVFIVWALMQKVK